MWEEKKALIKMEKINYSILIQREKKIFVTSIINLQANGKHWWNKKNSLFNFICIFPRGTFEACRKLAKLAEHERKRKTNFLFLFEKKIFFLASRKLFFVSIFKKMYKLTAYGAHFQ